LVLPSKAEPECYVLKLFIPHFLSYKYNISVPSSFPKTSVHHKLLLPHVQKHVKANSWIKLEVCDWIKDLLDSCIESSPKNVKSLTESNKYAENIPNRGIPDEYILKF
jgi:hypothetical protein